MGILEALGGLFLGLLGVGLAVGLGGAGSSIGVGYAGRSAAGVLAEDPDKFGKLIILVALPGTQGFYGLLGGIMILGQIKMGIPVVDGLRLLGCALPVAIACLFSGIHQGKVCASGCQMVAKRPEAMFKAVMYGAMVETYAILGLVTTLLALYGITD